MSNIHVILSKLPVISSAMILLPIERPAAHWISKWKFRRPCYTSILQEKMMCRNCIFIFFFVSVGG